MYWVVYSFFTIIEAFVSIILYWYVHTSPTLPPLFPPNPPTHPPPPNHRIPFYYAFKLAFLVYLGYPGWNGATLIYNNFLKGLLQKYESAVDSHLDAAKASVTAAAASGVSQTSGETDIKKHN